MDKQTAKKMPDKEETEKKRDMSEVKIFKRNSLKHSETSERKILPTQAEIEQEKQAMQQKSS